LRTVHYLVYMIFDYFEDAINNLDIDNYKY